MLAVEIGSNRCFLDTAGLVEQCHARRDQHGYRDNTDERVPEGMPDGLLPAAELLLARLEPGALILRVVHMAAPYLRPLLWARSRRNP
jgi:hypothetical protein